ncbi:hypothetical protein LZD49_07150 [Dyadobacter sp. CY261]|uniref:hypothetical protein n=1 Tax=Dyadobacter sp. CY261 TaxID=2907203 RepID=UPI001F27D4D7|nr:hypothetical protein [Dyadobacter sp. CY261]MCF0070243.1 hypothetical protein [Dyadobacter sp. CY261]
MDITTKIKTFEDACEALGLDSQLEIPYPHPASDRQKGINAAAKLFIIAEALNEGWKPNWEDWDEYKYYPWFNMSAGGSGFSFLVYGYDDSLSDVGSRLVFRSRELAEYAGETFLDIYRDWMLFG